MYAAYEGLSETMRLFLDGLEARHDFAVNTLIGFAHETIEQQDLDEHNAAVHPVVRTHPESGRKCLFVNPGNTAHLVGLHPEESTLLLEFLYKHATQSEYVYRHRWRTGDLVIWDNRSVLHRGMAYKPTQRRVMHRATVAGDGPLI